MSSANIYEVRNSIWKHVTAIIVLGYSCYTSLLFAVSKPGAIPSGRRARALAEHPEVAWMVACILFLIVAHRCLCLIDRRSILTISADGLTAPKWSPMAIGWGDLSLVKIVRRGFATVLICTISNSQNYPENKGFFRSFFRSDKVKVNLFLLDYSAGDIKRLLRTFQSESRINTQLRVAKGDPWVSQHEIVTGEACEVAPLMDTRPTKELSHAELWAMPTQQLQPQPQSRPDPQRVTGLVRKPGGFGRRGLSDKG